MGNNKKGFVYLIGAGPGDPSLITIKGAEAIKKAQVIVYDRLINEKLLDYAPNTAKLIYVGKSPERHILNQGQINKLLVELALEGKVIARLKGGDPFVFGRGGEEALELVKAGIDFEVIPGITSAVAVPAYAGIPVTHRGLASNVAFVTGNEDPTKENSSINWHKLSTSVDTLVFLMGMSNLSKIVGKLIENGRDPKTPIALIRWGTLPKQETLIGTLETVIGLAGERQFKNPAIIIVGNVVSLRDKLKWFEKKPLWGKKVIITRARNQASTFSKMIEELGGEAIEFPAIKIVPAEDYAPLDAAISQISEFDWIIFTSVNGVKVFYDRLHLQNKDTRELKGVKLCAIGPKTKQALEACGLLVDAMPQEYRAEAVIEQLSSGDIKGQRILLPRADIARKILPQALEELGANVEDVIAYKTVCSDTQKEYILGLLKRGKVDYLTFTSSSTVKNFVSMFEKDELDKYLRQVKLASIGPITTKTMTELGLNLSVEAKNYTLEGLLNAIITTI